MIELIVIGILFLITILLLIVYGWQQSNLYDQYNSIEDSDDKFRFFTATLFENQTFCEAMGDVFFNNNSTTSNNLHWLNVSMVFGRGTVKEARVVELSSDNPILSSHHPFVGVLKSPALASIQSLRGHTGDAQR